MEEFIVIFVQYILHKKMKIATPFNLPWKSVPADYIDMLLK